MPIWGGTNHQHGPAGHAGPTTPTRPRLTYFAGWGLAEQCRWVMAACGVEWDQTSLSRHEEFVALRDGGALTFGQLPLLEVDGLRIVQSQAIVRYVARRGGLVGVDDAECATIDMVAEAVRDARSGLTSYPFSDDPPAHASQCRARLMGKQLPYLEAVLRRGGGAVVPSGLSYADVLIAEMLEGYVGMLGPGLLDDLPWLKALHDRVLALEGVASYLCSTRRHPFPGGDVGRAYVANVNAVLHGK
jgi:glutathione S-transferase